MSQAEPTGERVVADAEELGDEVDALGRSVALKTILPESQVKPASVLRFIREAQIAAYYKDFATRPEKERQALRARAYEALAQKYPTDDEAQIFAALYVASTQSQADQTYAAYLKAHFPAIWAAGGNIRGNDTYRWWTAYRQGDRSPKVMHWWNVTRPAWIARHFRDHRLPGVIAQIKWGTVGTLGVAGMKRVVESAIRKRYAD